MRAKYGAIYVVAPTPRLSRKISSKKIYLVFDPCASGVHDATK
jgi:hypothetical protein